MVKSLGSDSVIDYTQKDFTKYGKTYDIVFDTVGKRSFSECKGSLTNEGIYLTTAPTLAVMLQALWPAKRGSKRAKFAAAGLRPAREKIKDLVFLTELIEAGKFRAVIDRCYPLEQMADAHRYVEKRPQTGKCRHHGSIVSLTHVLTRTIMGARLTKRAADEWDSTHFTNSFQALSFFLHFTAGCRQLVELPENCGLCSRRPACLNDHE